MSVLVKKKEAFTEYPEMLDKYFRENEVVIQPVPKEFIQSIERKNAKIQITSAKQYFEYIQQEMNFWNSNDPRNKFAIFSGGSSLESALQNFQTALNYAKNLYSYSSIASQLKNSVVAIEKCLCSKTTLAKYLVSNLSDKDSNYIRGFKTGLLSAENTTVHSTKSDMEGFYNSLIYKKSMNDVYRFAKEDVEKLVQNISDANDNYSMLNQLYTISYREHSVTVMELQDKVQGVIEDMTLKAEEYFKEKNRRSEELEKLYAEKLKLQAPAEYWSQVEKDYTCKGRLWMGVSVVFSILIIALLVLMLVFFPNIFSENSDWFVVIKNSAIITVVTSIGVYILRYFVKLSTSSFHLSRDAKERNKLTMFYLALIEKNAVTEKERAIILNSLFSRSDTGLLKGDSSPTMSSNVNELVESLNKR